MSDGLLPPNASPLERALEQTTRRAFEVPIPVSSVWDPDTCPAALLPWLAWAYGVDEWRSAWSEEQKRAVIRNALYIHRHRGTVGAVKSALSALGHQVSVVEWFEQEPKGQPGTFKIIVEIPDAGIQESVYSELEQVATAAKNVRSHLTATVAHASVSGSLFAGGATSSGCTTEIAAHPYTGVLETGAWNDSAMWLDAQQWSDSL